MTDLLSKAFKKASELSEDSQDSIANRLLEEIEDEIKWNNSFESSKDKLSAMATEAVNKSDRGKTLKIGFDEI
ncbi:MAG TPA: hypothetical protein PK605_15635 [Ignavibacteria bacterium]|nr:hypothetical protein [Ignavibacteria bacterium]HAX49243.1 hypothetical protein [Bacteroidota bacterium]HRE11294.1 hypothetical protein [Ignavibacteria bacterium]HRF65686.1 hypothetical protein [Ignavibacteria bacterium]HRJ05835.1 hypothetical protein [Ignavibacteria bacterium]